MKNALVSIAIGLIKLLSLLPLSVMHRIGYAMAWINWQLNTRMVKVSRKNIRLCYPDYSEQQVEFLTKQSVLETGMTLTESGMTSSKINSVLTA